MYEHKTRMNHTNKNRKIYCEMMIDAVLMLNDTAIKFNHRNRS